VDTHPPEPLLIHRLPPAPNFVGREAERAGLRDLWTAGFRGVLALVGLGGAGKTAVAAHFLEELLGTNELPRPEGLLVWSFYQEPDAGLFLQEAHHYFARPDSSAPPARGAGLLHLLRDALAAGGPHLLVLDGLERVQRPGGGSDEVFGQIEDPLLKGLLTRIAEGIGQTTVLVTSRFPLTDLAPFQGHGYRHIDIGGLGREAARALLRHRGVRGDEPALDQLVDAYGAHALTLDHLGGLIGEFLGGDPTRAPEVPLVPPGTDRQALRLARLLRAYEDHLPPAELALLCRLCLLRRSVREEHLLELFLCSPPIHARTVRELTDLLVRFPGFEKHLRGELMHNMAESVCHTLEEALCAAAIAGPEATFRREIAGVAEKVLELFESPIDMDVAELARLYARPALDHPTDLLPLDTRDRTALHFLYSRYVELGEHPLMPVQEVAAPLKQAFLELGYGKKPRREGQADLTPSDVWDGFKQARLGLRFLTIKHFALRRVRELCRLGQSKWILAGALAPLDAGELHQVLGRLVERHLVLREADGSFSVHPAVRDHFGRLAAATEQEGWHDVIREQLISLVQRPGRRLPEDSASLDLMEEAVYHARQAGRTEEARWLYEQGLGGLRHLAWKLGEMARGLRILRGFDPCPDRWSLGWYLRALGEFEEALAHNDFPFFRADVRLLQGRLPEVAALGDSTRTATAAFLMGQTRNLPPEQLGSAVPREQFLLYLGRLDRAGRSTLLEGFYHDIGLEGDRARSQLLLAEVARRQANMHLSRQYLDAASTWILRSGSVEHLCLFHLVRARLARDRKDLIAAQHAVDEGLHIARQCGLGLYHIELLCEQAEICLDRNHAPAAERLAREAQRRALGADCQFLWGAAAAGHLVGEALVVQKRSREARTALAEALALRRRIGDPGEEVTAHLLTMVGD
jgi:hypothetical protein